MPTEIAFAIAVPITVNFSGLKYDLNSPINFSAKAATESLILAPCKGRTNPSSQ